MLACGVFDAFDSLVNPCGVDLESGDLLLVVSDGLDHGHDVGGRDNGDAFCDAQGFSNIINEFELFIVLYGGR